MTGDSATVLVVEDEPQVRELLSLALTAPHRELLTAATQGAALELADGRTIDLLLTDVLLPDGTGVELAQTLRQAQPKLRVIYLSGAYDQANFPAIGDDLLLVKPFSLDGLRRSVTTVLAEGT